MKINFTLFIFLVLILAISVGAPQALAQELSNLPELAVFHSLSCHKCIQTKKNILPQIQQKFIDKVKLKYYDIEDIENYKILLSLKDALGEQDNLVVPIFYIQGHFFKNNEISVDSLSKFIAASLANPKEVLAAKRVDLVSRFKGFSFLAITGIGLIDGINPCAFTVIVFFMTFLALQGYRKRQLAAIGICFISAVFITYLLIGLGAFSFLYRLSHFWLLTKVINILVGIFSISLAIFALSDFIKFKKTGKTEGLVLQLPQPIKNQIHKVIGAHYRVDKNSQESSLNKSIFSLMLSALITGFLVSLLEAVCTGQTYLPTITFILKSNPGLKLEALMYLVLYNLMFIVPLAVVFIFALKGSTSENFAKFLKKHMLLIKALMAILFFFVGVFLIWRA